MKPLQKKKNSKKKFLKENFDVFFVFFLRIIRDSRFIRIFFANKMYYTFFLHFIQNSVRKRQKNILYANYTRVLLLCILQLFMNVLNVTCNTILFALIIAKFTKKLFIFKYIISIIQQRKYSNYNFIWKLYLHICFMKMD